MNPPVQIDVGYYHKMLSVNNITKLFLLFSVPSNDMETVAEITIHHESEYH